MSLCILTPCLQDNILELQWEVISLSPLGVTGHRNVVADWEKCEVTRENTY